MSELRELVVCTKYIILLTANSREHSMCIDTNASLPPIEHAQQSVVPVRTKTLEQTGEGVETSV